MGKMSREKGKRYERELAAAFREYGYDARRTAQYCGKTGDAADVTGLPGIHVEAKHVEKVSIYDWMSQAIHDAQKSGRIPVVFFRKNNAQTLVTLRLCDFMEIYKEWEASNGLQAEKE